MDRKLRISLGFAALLAVAFCTAQRGQQVITTNSGLLSITYGFTIVENPLSDNGNFTGYTTGAPQVPSSGVCEPIATGHAYSAYWSGNSWSNDQSSSETLLSLGGSLAYATVAVRVTTTGGLSDYEFDLTGLIGSSGSGSQIQKNVTGTNTVLVSSVTLTPHVGDVFKLAVIGSSLTVTQNGTSIATATDSSVTSGSPGFGFYNGTAITDSQISSWTGASLD
jgi:hypothetical protein